jgi:hypothetical protein
MTKTSEELRQIIIEYTAKILAIPEMEFSAKPFPHKWSKKEVLGHLTDSAHNNLRRFICGQYEVPPPYIVYDQDFWVQANEYSTASKEDTVQLWRLLNQRICTVLNNMHIPNYSKVCNTGKGAESLHTLQWLAEDYVSHLKHHLDQIIPGSFDVLYK